MLSPKQKSLTCDLNINVTNEIGQFKSKTSGMSLGQKIYREKMIKYLSFCFPALDVVVLHDTLNECEFQLKKAVNILEKVSGFTVAIDFISWLNVITNSLEKVKNVTKPCKNDTQGGDIKVMTKRLKVSEEISREEQILDIIEKSEIVIENAALMQLLAKPVVYLEKLPFSTTQNTQKTPNKKLDLSSNRVKTTKSPVTNNTKVASPGKRKIKLDDEIKEPKKRKTFANINKINKEINSILDNDILQSLSSEKIFREVENNQKCCDEVIEVPSAVIPQETANSIDKNDTINANKQPAILTDNHNRKESQDQSKNNGQKLSNSDVRSPLLLLNNEQETSCSSDKVVANRVDKEINKNNNCEKDLSTGQENSHSTAQTQKSKINCEEKKLLTITPEENKTENSNSEKRNLPTTNQVPVSKVSVTLEQVVNTLLPLIQNLISITERKNQNSNSDTFHKIMPMVSNSLKNYLSTVSIDAFNIYSFINMVASKLSRNDKSPDLEPKIVTQMFKILSITTSKSVEESEFLLRFYTELKKMANEPKYMLDPLINDDNDVQIETDNNKPRFYNGHTYDPVDKSFLANVIQVHKITKPSKVSSHMDQQNCNGSSQTYASQLSYLASSKTKSDFGLGQNPYNPAHDSYPSQSNKSSPAPPNPNMQPVLNSFDLTNTPVINNNCSTSTTPGQTLGNQPASSLVNNRSAYSDQSQILYGRKVLYNSNEVPVSVRSSSSTSPNRVCSIKPTQQQPACYQGNNLNNNIAMPPVSCSASLGTSSDSYASKNQKTSSALSASRYDNTPRQRQQPSHYNTNSTHNQRTLSTPSSLHSTLNTSPTSSMSNFVSQCNTQKQQYSGYRTVAYNNNMSSIQNQGTIYVHSGLKAPTAPNTVPHCNTPRQEQQPPAYTATGSNNSNVQSQVTFSATPSFHSALNCNVVSYGNSTVASNTNSIHNQGIFSTPSSLQATVKASPMVSVSDVVSHCNTRQKQPPPTYSTAVFNNNRVQNQGTFLTPSCLHPTLNTPHMASASNVVPQDNIPRQKQSFGYSTNSFNANSIHTQVTFSAPPSLHSSLNTPPVAPASNVVSQYNTPRQKQQSSGYSAVSSNNNSIHGQGTFSTPFLHPSLNASPAASGSTAVPQYDAPCQKQQSSGCSAVSSNNNSIRSLETFSTSSLHPSLNALLATSVSNGVPQYDTRRQKQQSSGYSAVSSNNNSIHSQGTFSTSSLHPSLNDPPAASGSTAVRQYDTPRQKRQSSGCSAVPSNNKSIHSQGTFSTPSLCPSLNSPPAASGSNVVQQYNTPRQMQSSGCSAVSSNNNSIRSQGTFSTSSLHPSLNAPLAASGSTAVPQYGTPRQKRQSSGCSAVSSNNNSIHSQGTFSTSSLHPSLNAPPAASGSTAVPQYDTPRQKLQSSGCSAVSSNNNSIHSQGTFSTSSLHPTLNALLATSVSNGVPQYDTRRQKRQPSGCSAVSSNNKSIHSQGTFSTPSLHPSLNSPPAASGSNVVQQYNTPRQMQSSGYRTTAFNTQGTFSTPSSLPSTLNAPPPAPSISNVASHGNTPRQKEQLPGYRASVINNNNIQNQGHYHTPTLSSLPSSSNASATVSECNIPRQKHELSRFNNCTPVYFCANVNDFPALLNSNNGMKRLILRKLPAASVSSVGPKFVQSAVSQRAASGNDKELNSTRKETITGNFPLTFQSFEQPNFDAVHFERGLETVGKEIRGGGGEDDSMASLKSYEMNMNLMFPSINENCPGATEFVDLDDYYGACNN